MLKLAPRSAIKKRLIMTPSFAISLLEKFGINEVSSSGDFLRFPCPFREITHREKGKGKGKSCYSLDISRKNPKGYCFVCEDHSSFSELLLFLAILRKSDPLYEIAVDFSLKNEEDTISKVESAYAELRSRVERKKKADHNLRLLQGWHKDLRVDKRSHTFLVERGFDEALSVAMIEQFDLRHDPNEDRLVFPMFSPYNGDLLGAQGRAYSSGIKPKYRHYAGSQSRSCFFSNTLKSPFSEEIKSILLVEGPFDVMRCFAHQIDLFYKGVNTFDIMPMAINGSRTSDDQNEVLSKAFKPVYSMLDNDDAGRKGNSRIMRSLKGKIPKGGIIELPAEVNDPDGLSLSQFEEIVRRHIHE